MAYPCVSVVAAVLACQQALGSWPLSAANLRYAMTWGAVSGIAGGFMATVLARFFPRRPVSIKVAAPLVVAALSSASLYVYAVVLASV